MRLTRSFPCRRFFGTPCTSGISSERDSGSWGRIVSRSGLALFRLLSNGQGGLAFTRHTHLMAHMNCSQWQFSVAHVKDSSLFPCLPSTLQPLPSATDTLMSTWSQAYRLAESWITDDQVRMLRWNYPCVPVNWTGWARIVVATLDTERRARRTERFLAFRRAMSSKRISGSWGRLVSRRLYMERRHSRAGMFLSWWAWHKKCIKDEMEWV